MYAKTWLRRAGPCPMKPCANAWQRMPGSCDVRMVDVPAVGLSDVLTQDLLAPGGALQPRLVAAAHCNLAGRLRRPRTGRLAQAGGLAHDGRPTRRRLALGWLGLS